MNNNFLEEFKKHLTAQKIPFRNGVSSSVIEKAESKCGAKFPPDLIFLLSNIVIDDGHFLDWGKISNNELQNALNWPHEGLCFDIEHNSLWLDSWGKKPDNLADKISAFTAFYKSNAPVLIPVFGHRYISSAPCESGNPVYSVYQSDIIFYGVNLENYLANEYKMQEFDNNSGAPKLISFWEELAS